MYVRLDSSQLLPLLDSCARSLQRLSVNVTALQGDLELCCANCTGPGLQRISGLKQLRIQLNHDENLTQLDVSENAIEVLDLSALSKLQTLQCSRNSLRELTVNGRHLTSLIAGNNQLRTLSASPTPLQLEHLDVSNRLATLPGWVGGCSRLRALFASHNELTAAPQQLLSGQLPNLHTLQLSYNELQQLPAVSSRLPLALHHLFLQSNRLAALPCNLFTVATRLRVLNVSNNRLEELPAPPPMHDAEGDRGSPLDKLYLTANCLGDAALRSLAAFRRLRTLHAAYNHLSVLPDSCVASWPDLEELVLSGNTLRHLPENIVQLRHLRVLRVHSNQLRNSPCFSRMTSLKVLDLSHNQLDRVSLATLAPPQLQFLDLSCNSRLHVDPRQFSVYRSQRQGGPGSISLVDVSGLNRSSLPTAPPARPPTTPWAVGFSETPGLRERLYIAQLRLPSFCNSEGLFGLFDGGGEGSLPAALVRAVPRILVEERAVTETAADYLKYTLLSAHRELREHGQKQGACATLVHVCPRGSRYVLRVASVGEAKALELRESDDFLVVANQRLWEVVSEREAMQEVRAASSPLLAAKRLQDMAQSYGCEDNISVVVLRLGALALPTQVPAEMAAEDVNILPPVSASCSCCAPCCRCRHDRSSPSGQSDQASCESRAPALALHAAPQPAPRRPMLNGVLGGVNGVLNGSSAGTMYKATRCRVDNVYRGGGSGGSGCSDSGGDTSCGSGTGSDRSHLSEEQFRCWEYMLEQNTQLLFDKELDTLSRAFTRRPVPRGHALSQALGMGRALSSSSPHLAHAGGAGPGVGPGGPGAPVAPHPAAVPTPTPPFLSRHFGSARSLSCTPTARRLGLGVGGLGGLHAGVGGLGSSRQLLHTGPNAAYFGSLQRLMPYNLEYDFDVIHERAENGHSMSGSLIDQRADQDSLEQDGRMRKYWDVATTEL
ncbi:hypothetical protein FOCC_FOCC010826 [Frankliniella occidentalis]|nr:hypothetical protein FOCC_FOCC010826 [Frankliniella occidentalis]